VHWSSICAQCKEHIKPGEVIFVDFKLKISFCFNCSIYCHKCQMPDFPHCSIVPNGPEKWSLLCRDCKEEYDLYLNPPCPSHPQPTNPDVV
jgi:hypothetical protein